MEECSRLIIEFEIQCKKILLIGAQRDNHPQFKKIQKHLQDLELLLKKAVPWHVPFPRDSARAVDCEVFFRDRFDQITPVAMAYAEDILKVCKT